MLHVSLMAIPEYIEHFLNYWTEATSKSWTFKEKNVYNEVWPMLNILGLFIANLIYITNPFFHVKTKKHKKKY